jgi:hypothetical protein
VYKAKWLRVAEMRPQPFYFNTFRMPLFKSGMTEGRLFMGPSVGVIANRIKT